MDATPNLPPQLAAEHDALIEEIYGAFDGVTREGGVSWSEARVIDGYGTDQERERARGMDIETSWMQLVTDEEWYPGSGIGGWCFLDAIGFRYYLPAAMLRCIDRGGDEGICYWLNLDNVYAEWWLDKWSAFDDRQRRCITRFLRYMAELAFEKNFDVAYDECQAALDSHWSTFGA